MLEMTFDSEREAFTSRVLRVHHRKTAHVRLRLDTSVRVACARIEATRKADLKPSLSTY